jgi:hypothetical protein
VLDHFVDGTSGSGCQSTPERKLPFVAPNYLNSYWSAQEKGNEKFTLIQEIVESLPERDVICAIQEVFLTRCQGALGNVIHTTSFKKQAETLVDFLGLPSTEDKVLALAGVFSLDALACHLLAVRFSNYGTSD